MGVELALDVTDTLLEVPLMDDVEAEKLVHVKRKHLNSKQVELHLVVNLLRHLLLALVHAAAYVRKTTITTLKCMLLYNENKETRIRLLEEDFINLEQNQYAENAVLKTWVLSCEQIRLKDPKVVNLLSTISFLDAKSVLDSLLLQIEIPDTLGLADALTTLKVFALVTSSEDGEVFDIYRIV